MKNIKHTGLWAAILLSLSTHTVSAASPEKSLITSDGNPVMDRFGDCVVTLFGDDTQHCKPLPKPAVKSKPTPKPVVKPKPTPKPIIKPKPVAKPKPQPIKIKPHKPVQTLHLSADAYFDHDKYQLKPAGQQSLQQLAQQLRQAKVKGIAITGHTDSDGSHAYNQQLSWQRAFSAAHFLITLGVPESVISIHGLGKTQPITNNQTAAAKAKNRRVEIKLTIQR